MGKNNRKKINAKLKNVGTEKAVRPNLDGVFVSKKATKDIFLEAIKKLDVEKRKNSRIEELAAYFSLYDVLGLKDMHIIIGDAVAESEPDFFDVNHKVGVEVVTCGSNKDYTYCARKLGGVNDFKKFPVTQKYLIANYNPDADTKPFLELFEQNIALKYNNLNSGSYTACDDRYLFVFANMLPKNVDPAQLQDIVAYQAYDREVGFKSVFVSMNNQLLELPTTLNEQYKFYQLPEIAKNDYIPFCENFMQNDVM